MSARLLSALPLHDRRYRAAVICGAAPLVTGISIFLLWLATRMELFMFVGLYTIYAGLVAVAAGVLILAIYCWVALRRHDQSRRRVWLATLACTGLLLANFPVAFGIVMAVIDIETSYIIVVHNASEQPLDEVRVFGGGCDVSLGSIAPGRTVSQKLRFKTDGTLRFRAVTPTAALEDVLVDDYVTSEWSGGATVTVESDGMVSVESRD